MAYVRPEQRDEFVQEHLPDTTPQEPVSITAPDGSVVLGPEGRSPIASERDGLTVGKTGHIRGGQSTYNVGKGFFLGYYNGAYVFSFGTGGSTTNNLTYDGTTLSINGNLTIGGLSITMDTTGNIQTNLNTLNTAGGGTLYLKAGTYTQNTALTGYSSVKMVGLSASQTIIDFNSTTSNITFAGTNIYTTGTVTAIASGTNVTGSGTTWTAGMAGRAIFLGTRWYIIASVTNATSLVLAEKYGDNVTLPASYRIATTIKDFSIQNIQLKNSTGTALVVTDGRQFNLNGVVLLTNNVGYSLTNCSEQAVNQVSAISSTSDGVQYTNVGLCNVQSLNVIGNGGNGLTLNNVKTVDFSPITADSNTGDGVNATTVVNAFFLLEASSNTGKGIQFVSGCDNCDISSGTIQNNISDGIKLTASTTNSHFYACSITGNGGYGINIPVAGDSNNVITTNNFATNTSGAVNDLGTSTLIRGNVGVTDTSTSSSVKFGGSGSDGALSIASGTTTIDCANASLVVKNYTSISITGTGKLAFINPNTNGTIVVLKSQGNITLTSSSAPMIDMSGMGGAGGAGGGAGPTNGQPGKNGNSYYLFSGGGAGGINANAAGGTAVAFIYTTYSQQLAKYYGIFIGGGGGGGYGNTNTGGAGGAGGGGLIIECGVAWNFTTTSGISVAGANGSVAVGSSGGGGGGGGGGFFFALYNSLTANTGTITISGGTGGAGVGLGVAGGGGGGASSVAGSAASDTTGIGATGAIGQSQVALNNSFT